MSMPHFPHRHNPDGTYDSICTKCFATIGTRETEEELVEIEAEHKCNPALFYNKIIPINRK